MAHKVDRHSHLAEIRLSNEDQAAISYAAKCVQAYDPVTETEQYVMEAQIRSSVLSDQLSRVLLEFRRRGHPVGGLILHGVPIGDIPPTPSRADLGVGVSLKAAASMSVIVGKLGDQYGFRPELGGRIAQDVLPVAGVEETQQSISSNIRLEDHVEMAFSDHRSDYVGLLCLRPDHERVAATTLASVDRILPSVDDRALEILQEPRFKTEVDESFLVGGGFDQRIWVGPIAILGGKAQRPRLRGDFALTMGLDAEAEAALENLRHATEKATYAIVLDAGDLVLVDNHHAFHGRTLFKAKHDGRDRWLLRTFVIKDLSRTEDVRPGDGRIIDTDYSTGPDVLTEVQAT